MRGAVLHSLGLNVKERIMRRSYGVIHIPVFIPGTHPERLKTHDISGVARCKDVMKWYALKVRWRFMRISDHEGHQNEDWNDGS